jgi:hypothetical protein
MRRGGWGDSFCELLATLTMQPAILRPKKTVAFPGFLNPYVRHTFDGLKHVLSGGFSPYVLWFRKLLLFSLWSGGCVPVNLLGKGQQMPKVTMALTERDVSNTSNIREATQARSNAQAVSIALSLANFIVNEMRRGNELLLASPEGQLQRVIMTELANVVGPQDSAPRSSFQRGYK